MDARNAELVRREAAAFERDVNSVMLSILRPDKVIFACQSEEWAERVMAEVRRRLRLIDGSGA